MQTPAQVLLYKLNPQRVHLAKIAPHTKNKKIDRITSDRALIDFVDHLKWLSSRHIKKQLSQEYLTSTCFSTKNVMTQTAANAYCRVQLVVALTQFIELLAILKGKSQTVSHAMLMKDSEIIRDYIFDLKPIAEHLERKKNPKYVFFNGVKSYGVLTWPAFCFSRQLANLSISRSLPHNLDHRMTQITSIFVLRQVLEAKFTRLIAVDIRNSTGDAPRLRHEFHYDFIVANKQYFDFKTVEFDNLKYIYRWCNEIVHGVYQPLGWQVAYAHSICCGLFQPIATPKFAAWSIHNAVCINNLDQMQSAFMEHFSKNYDHGIWAVTAGEPEAEVV